MPRALHLEATGFTSAWWKMANHELLDTESAAEYLGLRAHSLEVWRSTGRYKIPFVRVGRLVKYRRADLDAWLQSRTVNMEAA